jgi:hypothetical protein
MVRPLPYLDDIQYQPGYSGALSDQMAEQAAPHQKAALADTEHDSTNQWRFEPVKKRRHRTPTGRPLLIGSLRGDARPLTGHREGGEILD